MLPGGKQILIIDGSTESADMRSVLRSLGARVRIAPDLATAEREAAHEEFDMALVAVEAAGEQPGEFVRRLNRGARIPSILMLASPREVRRAVSALSQGADDYLLKPLDRAEVQARVGRILRAQELTDHVGHLHKEMSRRYILGNLVSRSRGMHLVRTQIMQVAAARSTVLIVGESGVGKELVAKAIHFNSPRRRAPFIAINCSAIPVNLIESELFGHERGAFTGAIERQKGKFELAHGGTILLDEIGDMDLATQAKLLRVLEERAFMRVGGAREVRVDVRVLAATNSDLAALITRRRFREDLYFRLNVITIQVPPLRQRAEDIAELSRAFLSQICEDNGLGGKRLTGQAIQALRRHAWPGNARELKNVLESTAITHPGELVRLSDLPARLRPGSRASGSALPRSERQESLEEAERNLLERTLSRHGGNRTRAARALRIGVRTLQRKIGTYGIAVPYSPSSRQRTAQRSTETPSPVASSEIHR
jgi:DNA-binding NtrC family response regulator